MFLSEEEFKLLSEERSEVLERLRVRSETVPADGSPCNAAAKAPHSHTNRSHICIKCSNIDRSRAMGFTRPRPMRYKTSGVNYTMFSTRLRVLTTR